MTHLCTRSCPDRLAHLAGEGLGLPARENCAPNDHCRGCANGGQHDTWCAKAKGRAPSREDELTRLLLLARDCLMAPMGTPWPVSFTTLMDDIRKATAPASTTSEEER
jgi:hypothetical protein